LLKEGLDGSAFGLEGYNRMIAVLLG